MTALLWTGFGLLLALAISTAYLHHGFKVMRSRSAVGLKVADRAWPYTDDSHGFKRKAFRWWVTYTVLFWPVIGFFCLVSGGLDDLYASAKARDPKEVQKRLNAMEDELGIPRSTL